MILQEFWEIIREEVKGFAAGTSMQNRKNHKIATVPIYPMRSLCPVILDLAT